MKMIIKILILILTAVFSFGIFSACDDTTVSPDQDNNITDEKTDETDPYVEIGNDLGNKAPSFDLLKVNSEEKVNIKNFSGKTVVINFWGTWCNPCKSELPEFDQFASDRIDDVVIIAVHSVMGNSEASAYISENYSSSDIIFAYDVPLDEYKDMYFDLLGGTSYYPYTVILDKNGIITYKKDGKMSYEELENKVNEAMSEK